jgi:ribonucleoside-diphosphate reductase alpha chain
MQNDFSKNIMELRYSWIKLDGSKETWEEICDRVVDNVFSIVEFPEKQDVMSRLKIYMKERKFIPGGRFLAQSGRDFHQTNNCFLLRAEDTREGWGDLSSKATIMLMSGGGIGVDYSDLRPNGVFLKRSGGTSSGPIPLMKIINEIGRGVMSGGKRRSAIYASLRWSHPDIFEFIKIKDWIPEVRKIKEKDFDFPASMDMTNVSVILDKDFFDTYNVDQEVQVVGLCNSFTIANITKYKLYDCKLFFDHFSKLNKNIIIKK